MTNDAATTVRRIFGEGINERKLALFDELLAPNYVNYTFPAPQPGPEGFRQVIGLFLQAFPDLHEVSEDVIADGNRVAVRGHFTGTHQGEFMGIPATGRSVNVAYMATYHLVNGQVAENWVQMDMLGLMQQLGVIPTPESTTA